MKSAREEIRAIIYSNRSEEEILDCLKSYIALGDSRDDVERRNSIKFVDHPEFRLLGCPIKSLICKEAGVWINVAGKYGVINIVRLGAVVDGVEYRELKLGEKSLPPYFPFDSEEAMNEDQEMWNRARRQVDRAREREKMPFFKRLWSEITQKE